MNLRSHKENAFFYLACALAFALPLYQRLIPPLIILLVVSLFAGPYSASQLLIALKHKSSVLLILLYTLYAAGMLYTENKAAGWFDLQVKLSILLFPVILFPLLSFNEEKMKKMLKSFIIGCICAVIICFSVALFNYIREYIYISRGWYNLNHGINFFLSSRLSYFMHPSYFSMYLCFSLIFLLFYKGDFFVKPRIRYYLSSLIIFSIIFLASKAGLIILFLSFVAYFIMIQNIKIVASLSIVIVFLFGLLYFSAPEFAGKFNKAVRTVSTKGTDIKTSQSSPARILAWKSAIQIIKEQKVWGTGTGDVKDALIQRYSKNGYTGLLEKKLNAHNQFLQTGIALGYPGMIILIIIFIYSFYIHIKRKFTIGIMFTLIITVNLLFESMLETQAGVIFFAFFFSLFNIRNTENNE